MTAPQNSLALLFALTCVLLVAAYLGLPVETLWAVTSMVTVIGASAFRRRPRIDP